MRNIIKLHGIQSVSHIALYLPGRSIEEVKMFLIESGFSFPSYQKSWSLQDDELLKEQFQKYGGNLNQIYNKMRHMNPLLIRHRLFSVLLKDLVSADMFDQP